MEASHKTHRPHIKVGTDVEEGEEVCHIIQACCVFSLSQSTRRNHLIAFNIHMHIVNTAADGSYSMTEVTGDNQLGSHFVNLFVLDRLPVLRTTSKPIQN